MAYIYRIFGGGFNLANHVNIAKLNVRHLCFKHAWVSSHTCAQNRQIKSRQLHF